jgi:A/G-specific adenine glycosylase
VTAIGSLPIPAAGARRRRPSRVQAAILAWYDAEGRALPFRGTDDPWAVLVSEVMAQQTQVARVGRAWRAFMARFPDPATLASASPADVLRAWIGLGYNRRAIALQRAAQSIVERHDGRVPDDLAALEALPGVGPYTARAVLAIAFGRPVAPVDVNVRRVVARLAGMSPTTLGPRVVQELADDLVPRDRSGDWTHAMMDLGAVICRAGGPRCDACPARPWCATGRRKSFDKPPERERRRPAIRFESTNRWLRGAIVRRLAAEPSGSWGTIEGPIGRHEPGAVAVALRALAAEGLVELATDGRARLPSRTTPAG